MPAVTKPMIMNTTNRNVIEVNDTPIRTVSGRHLIRRVEKILMPNGRFRHPVTYIDMTPGFVEAPADWAKDRVKGYEMQIEL